MNDSKELIQFAFNEIEKRIGHLKCPLCGNNQKENFFIGERFYQIPSMTEGNIIEGKDQAVVDLKMPLEIVRAVPVSCKYCGHMMLFNIQAIQKCE